MARYNIELVAQINASTLKAAVDGLERIGLTADEAEAHVKAMASSTDAQSERMRASYLSVAAGIERMAEEASSGSTRAVKAIARQSVALEELRQEIDRVRATGGPISPEMLRSLDRFEGEIGEATGKVAKFRNAADDAKDNLKSLQGQTDLNRGSVNDLADVLELQGSKMSDLVGKGFALYGALMAGYEGGKKLREGLNWLTDGEFDKSMQRNITRLMEFLHLWDKAPDLSKDEQYQKNLENIRKKRGTYDDRLDFDKTQTKALEERLQKQEEARKKAEEAAKREAELWRTQSVAAREKLEAQRRLNAAASQGLEVYRRQVVLEQRRAELLNQIRGLSKDHAAVIREQVEETWRLQDASSRVLGSIERWGEILNALKDTTSLTRAILDQEWERIRQERDRRELAIFDNQTTQPLRDRRDAINAYREQLKLEDVGEAWIKEVRRIKSVTRTEAEGWGLTVEESQRLIGRLYREGASRLVGDLSSIISAISGVVGERGGLRTAQNILGQIQGVQRVYSSLYSGTQSLGQALGSASITGSASAVAAVGATFAIFAAVYMGVDSYLKKKRLSNYGNAMSLTVVEGSFGVDAMNFQAEKYLRDLRGVLEGIADSIHSTIESMPKVSVRIRNDGKKFESYVAGQLVGVFNSLEDATSAALAHVLRQIDFRGASEIVRQTLTNSTYATVEELNRNLQLAQELSDVALTDVEKAMRSISERIGDFLQFIRENRITDPSAMQNLGTLAGSLYGQLRDQLTGHQPSRQEQLERQRQNEEIFNAQLELEKARVKLERSKLQRERDLLEARGRIARANLQIDRGEFELDQFELLLGREFNNFKAEEIKERANLYQAELDAMDAQLRAMDDLLASLERIKPIAPGESKLPRSGRGGGLQSNPIADLIRQVNLQEMGNVERLLSELNDKYREATKGLGDQDKAEQRAARRRDEAIRAAHGNAEAIRRANAEYAQATRHIRENREELQRAADARQREIDILRRSSTAENLTPYLGGAHAGSRSDGSRQLAEIHRIYDDLRKTHKELGIALWQVNQAERERLRLLGLETASGLGSETAATILQFQQMGQSMSFLREHLAELGLTTEDFGRIASEVDQNLFITIGTRLAQMIGDEETLAMLNELRYDLDKANMRLQIESAYAAKVITEETYRELLELAGKLPDDLPAPRPVVADSGVDLAAERQAEAARTMQDAARRFETAIGRLDDITQSLLYGDQAIQSPQAQITELYARFQELLPAARRGDVASLEALAEVERPLIEAIRRAFGSTEGIDAAGSRILQEILAANQGLGGLRGYSVGNVAYDPRLLGATSPAPVQFAPPPSAPPYVPPVNPAGFGDVLDRNAVAIARELASLREKVASLTAQVERLAAANETENRLRSRELSLAESGLRRVPGGF